MPALHVGHCCRDKNTFNHLRQDCFAMIVRIDEEFGARGRARGGGTGRGDGGRSVGSEATECAATGASATRAIATRAFAETFGRSEVTTPEDVPWLMYGQPRNPTCVRVGGGRTLRTYL